MSPLSNRQKADIGIAARQAYLAWDGRGMFERVNSNLTATDCFAAWRHVEQGKVVGIQSLREMHQGHYNRVLAHFEELAGDKASATKRRGRDADNDRRVALYKLNQALQERGLEVGYVAVICRTKYKCELSQATAAQIWKLVFDVRTRRKAVAKKPIGEVPF